MFKTLIQATFLLVLIVAIDRFYCQGQFSKLFQTLPGVVIFFLLVLSGAAFGEQFTQRRKDKK